MFLIKVTKHMGIPFSKLRKLQIVLLRNEVAIVGIASNETLLAIRMARHTRLGQMSCRL